MFFSHTIILTLHMHGQLVDFYRQRFPDRVGKVDGVMAKFAGREHEITKMILDTVAKENAKAGGGVLQPAISPGGAGLVGVGTVDLLGSSLVKTGPENGVAEVAKHNIMSQFHQPAAFNSAPGHMGMGGPMGGGPMGGGGRPW
jgi:hypothetical protein